VQEVGLKSRDTDSFRAVLDHTEHERLRAALQQLREVIGTRRVWHVNSTAHGGGVAELLSSLLPYLLGAGIEARWLVVEGHDDFFNVTKRLHKFLHDNDGDNGPLGMHEREVYDAGLDEDRDEVATVIASGDVAILHDPQTAGLIRTLKDRGATVIWRSHVGVDRPGPRARAAWRFLMDDVSAADALVFSRPEYVWDGLGRARTTVIAPCIDVMSPKNHPLAPDTSAAILAAAGLVAVNGHEPATPEFVRTDGTRDKVERRAQVIEAEPVPVGAQLVLQVSRWDSLKDPTGVIKSFVQHIAPACADAHLMLAGPATHGVDDDPESAETFAEVRGCRDRLPESARSLVHLACLPMDDDDENSAMVNALQRRADVVAQKSLAEGFGLTVAEAMWKERPVVASRVGGIQDQIVEGESGLFVDPPDDLDEFGAAVVELLRNPARAEAIGRAARKRVCDCFLPTHHFEHEADLLKSIDG
jgi:trehalose synthase